MYLSQEVGLLLRVFDYRQVLKFSGKAHLVIRLICKRVLLTVATPLAVIQCHGDSKSIVQTLFVSLWPAFFYDWLFERIMWSSHVTFPRMFVQ